MNEPTDKELITLRQECRDDPRSEEEHWFILFARAVLAKWGTPPAVAGEPVAWLSTDSIGERYLCFTKPNDSDPVRPLVFGDTTPQPTQAQAGAVPLTDPEFVKCIKAAGFKTWDGRWWELKRQIEEAHGIGIKKENGNG